jgi:hypothetical protein
MRRPTLIAVAVFGVLLLVVFALNERPVQRGSERFSLIDLDVDAVDHLTITEGETTIELNREGSSWKVAGSGHLADPEAITRALEGLQSVDTSDVVSTAVDRQAEFGVDAEGGITVEAAVGSRTAARVVVGTAEAGGAYLREVGGDTVFEASRSLRHLFPSDVTRWHKLKLFDAELDDARRVEVVLAGEPAFSVVPSETGDGQQWRLEDETMLPDGFRFDGRAARSLAATLVGLRAKEIVAEPGDDAALGFVGKTDRLALATGSTTVALQLGASTEDDDVYARVDGRDEVFLIRPYQAKNLRKRLADMRDLRPMAIDAGAATGFSVNHLRQELSFVKGEQGWTIDPEGVQPAEGFEFDPQAVERSVQAVASLKATSLVEDRTPSAAGLDRPAATVTVDLADGGSASLSFGTSFTDDEDRTQYYVAGNADDRVYAVGEYHFNRFTRGWEAFKYVPPPTQGNNPFANMDPETLKNLPPEVRESIMKQMQEEQRKQQLLRQIQAQQGS